MEFTTGKMEGNHTLTQTIFHKDKEQILPTTTEEDSLYQRVTIRQTGDFSV
jgi:hypothetical protein